MGYTCMLGYTCMPCMHTCLRAIGQSQMSSLMHNPPAFETRSSPNLESTNKLGCLARDGCLPSAQHWVYTLSTSMPNFFRVGSGNQTQLFELARQAFLPSEPSPLNGFGRIHHNHKGFWDHLINYSLFGSKKPIVCRNKSSQGCNFGQKPKRIID